MPEMIVQLIIGESDRCGCRQGNGEHGVLRHGRDLLFHDEFLARHLL